MSLTARDAARVTRMLSLTAAVALLAPLSSCSSEVETVAPTTETNVDVNTTATQVEGASKPSQEMPAARSRVAEVLHRIAIGVGADKVHDDFVDLETGPCPIMKDVPLTFLEYRDDPPLESGIIAGQMAILAPRLDDAVAAEFLEEFDRGDVFVDVWCGVNNGAGPVISLRAPNISRFIDAEFNQMDITDRTSFDEADVYPFYINEDGSELRGECSTVCRWVVSHPEYSIFIRTGPEPQAILDWLQSEWVSELERAFTDENIWLFAAGGHPDLTQETELNVPQTPDADPIQVSCDGEYVYDDELPISVCSQGQSVILFQEAMGLDADGYFGPGTQAALASLQDRAGLPISRRIDAATWKHLGIAASAPYPDLNGDGVIDASEFPG